MTAGNTIMHGYRPGIDDDPQQQINYWTAGFEDNKVNELNQSGLRGRKLCVVLVALCILWLLALVTLLCNVLLISTLGIKTHGMGTMQFHRTDDEEHIVQFTGRYTELQNVVSQEGQIKGTKGKDLIITGSRVLLATNPDDKKDKRIVTTRAPPIDLPEEEEVPTTNKPLTYSEPSRFIDGRIRVDGAHDFQLMQFVGSNTAREMFSALTPKFMPDKRIKQVSTSTIITNKIRSPINDSLHVEVENVAFRGNEGNLFTAQRHRVNALNDILFYTPTTDDSDKQDGTMHVEAAHGVYLSPTIELSSAPSLMANREAYLLCACKSTMKLFVVKGIMKQCRIDPALCY